ncbi:MAG: DUF2617 family protein [Planctomycetaceae bacterium]|nr:DUF2617 family protein [Planctomycetaceae bacterium]
MAVQFARPDVADLVLRIYPRALHPELFDCHALAVAKAGPITVYLRLCSAGHAICLRQGKTVVTEAITEKNQPLPKQHCVLEQKLRGCRTRSVTLPHGFRYDVSCQLETLEPDLYMHLHDELLGDLPRADLSLEFPSPNRFSPAALSIIKLDVTSGSAVVHAFHTFPDHCAVVKTQSLYEWE